MTQRSPIILILGSGPDVIRCRDWDRYPFDKIVTINNAWRVRPDWDVLIHPEDFPAARRPTAVPDGQRIVTYREYVPAQNLLGGVAYAGGTMAFTAAYWALVALRPRVIAYLGCDMIYAPRGRTHFYGAGRADPLRDDPTLQSLEAKSARLMALAAGQGCTCVNLSDGDSRLVFPRSTPADLTRALPALPDTDRGKVAAALRAEREAGQVVPSGRYWEAGLDAKVLQQIDDLWLDTVPDERAAGVRAMAMT